MDKVIAVEGVPEVYVHPGSKLSVAIALMGKYNTDYLPVMEDGKVVGVLTAKLVLAAYGKTHRANEDYQRAISVKRRSYKLFVRGTRWLH
jgi:predicted transcriptional regulator